MRVIAEQSRCIGAAQCVLTAPTVFDHDENGLVVVLDPEPDQTLHAAIRTGLLLCPSGAIRLADQ
jgi:ferredoxin